MQAGDHKRVPGWSIEFVHEPYEPEYPDLKDLEKMREKMRRLISATIEAQCLSVLTAQPVPTLGSKPMAGVKRGLTLMERMS